MQYRFDLGWQDAAFSLICKVMMTRYIKEFDKKTYYVEKLRILLEDTKAAKNFVYANISLKGQHE